MKISRCGSKKFRGWILQADVESIVQWDDRNHTLDIITHQTDDRYRTDTSPHWRAQLTLTEVHLLLDCLATEATKTSGAELAKSLSPSVQSLLRLLFASSGLAQKPATESIPE